MVREVENFQNNPDRKIAALVCQNMKEPLTYAAPYIRILYALSGDMELHIDNKIIPYTAGCLIMANEWTKIEYLQTSGEMEMVNFLFKKEYFTDAVLNQLTEDSLVYRFFLENAKSNIKKSSFFVFQFEPNQDIHFFAMLLLKQTVKMQYKHNRITKSAFALLATEINALAEDHLQLKDSSLSSSILIYEIQSDIEHNYRDITLIDLAEKYAFHPNYLSGVIKEETGSTFSELVQKRRLKSACSLLKQTDLTVQEIIEEIGYSDKTHFYNLFKKEFGITPKQYRKGELCSTFGTND